MFGQTQKIPQYLLHRLDGGDGVFCAFETIICYRRFANMVRGATTLLPKNRQERKVNMKILVIGGVAAGTKAAAKCKRENRGDEVLVLTKSADISYAGCGLP